MEITNNFLTPPTKTLIEKERTQHIWRFENDWGVSIVHGPEVYKGTKGWNIVIIRFWGPDILDFELNVDNPITEDVFSFANANNEQVNDVVILAQRLLDTKDGTCINSTVH